MTATIEDERNIILTAQDDPIVDLIDARYTDFLDDIPVIETTGRPKD